MKLKELLDKASKGYPDELLSEYYDEEGKLKPDEEMDKVGDGLARFIVVELAETFDAEASDKAQLIEAQHAMQRAIDELNGVLDALIS